MSQTLTKPILLDETGQAIKTALQNIDETEAQDWLLTYEDVHSEMDDNVDRIATAVEGIKDILDISNRIVSKIAVTVPPTQTTYVPGETFNPDGMMVCAFMTNGVDNTLVDVTSICTYTDTPLSFSDTTVTITYTSEKTGNTFTTTQPIEVKVLGWNEGTDLQITKLLEAHYNDEIDLTQYWSVGDERTIHLSAMSDKSPLMDTHPEQDQIFVLMNVGGKDLVTSIGTHTTCAFIVGMKSILEKYENNHYVRSGGAINSTATSTGGWDACDRRSWCNDTFKNAIPSTIRPIFKQFKNTTGSGYPNFSTPIISNDYFALPAEKETFGTNYTANDTAEGGLTQFKYYETSSNRLKNPTGYVSTGTDEWWMRSPSNAEGSYPSECFCTIRNSNNYNYNTATSTTNSLSPFGVI